MDWDAMEDTLVKETDKTGFEYLPFIMRFCLLLTVEIWTCYLTSRRLLS